MAFAGFDPFRLVALYPRQSLPDPAHARMLEDRFELLVSGELKDTVHIVRACKDRPVLAYHQNAAGHVAIELNDFLEYIRRRIDLVVPVYGYGGESAALCEVH